MRTLYMSISNTEFNRFGFIEEKLSFSDLLCLLDRELIKQNLSDSVALAEKYDLSKMTMADINKEIRTVRKSVKRNSHKPTA